MARTNEPRSDPRDAPAPPLAKKRPASDNTGQSNESPSEPYGKRPRCSERLKERTIKPEKSCVKSEKSSHEVICPPLCHSPLSLPNPLTLPFYKTLRAPTCRRIIRDHCRNTLDHDMLWEVAERDDFVTNDELRRHPDVAGPTLVLVQSLLKVGIFPDATGRDALIVLLTRWSDFLDAKGMATLRSTLKVIDKYKPLERRRETQRRQRWVANAKAVVSQIENLVMDDAEKQREVQELENWCGMAAQQVPLRYRESVYNLVAQRLRVIVDHTAS